MDDPGSWNAPAKVFAACDTVLQLRLVFGFER